MRSSCRNSVVRGLAPCSSFGYELDRAVVGFTGASRIGVQPFWPPSRFRRHRTEPALVGSPSGLNSCSQSQHGRSLLSDSQGESPSKLNAAQALVKSRANTGMLRQLGNCDDQIVPSKCWRGPVGCLWVTTGSPRAFLLQRACQSLHTHGTEVDDR